MLADSAAADMTSWRAAANLSGGAAMYSAQSPGAAENVGSIDTMPQCQGSAKGVPRATDINGADNKILRIMVFRPLCAFKPIADQSAAGEALALVDRKVARVGYLFGKCRENLAGSRA